MSEEDLCLFILENCMLSIPSSQVDMRQVLYYIEGLRLEEVSGLAPHYETIVLVTRNVCKDVIKLFLSWHESCSEAHNEYLVEFTHEKLEVRTDLLLSLVVLIN
jgi:hypothetical protein